MIRIHRFSLPVSTYSALGKWNLFPQIYDCPQPGCHHRGRLRRHGFYSRRAIALDGVFTVFIQRYLCPACGRTVSLLPSFLAPRFQYTLVAVMWLLHGLHGMKRSMRAVVRAWHDEGGCPELNRQHLQFVERRLRKQAAMCRLLLGVGDDEPVGAQLVRLVPAMGGIECFAEHVWQRWRRPFLSFTR